MAWVQREEQAIRSARFGRRLMLLACLIAAGVMAVTAASLWQSRQETWDAAERASRNVVAALGHDIGGSLRQVEAAMQGAAEGLALPNLWDYPPAVRFLILFDRSAKSVYLRSILIFDAAGDSIADSQGELPRRVNVADRDYFQMHQARRDAGLVVSAPFLSRLVPGQRNIALSRRIDAPDGSFAGVIAATISLPAIQDRLSGITLGPDSSLSLLAMDGSVLVRDPPLAASLARNLTGAPSFERIKRTGEGDFVGHSSRDGSSRLFVFTRPGGLPLILNAAVSTREIMRPWLLRAGILAGVTVLLGAGVVGLTFLFQRELTRRGQLEAALAALAVTDPLTGLANRRGIDHALAQAWRAARQAGTPLSFLMIDIDWFKQFNDAYGHTAGDRALRAVAGALLQVATAPGVQAARYGGEEFCLLLPGADAVAARSRAEALRQAVAALALPHAGSPGGVLSVSIGVATLAAPGGAAPAMPPGHDPGEALRLVEAADGALYRAKAAGRDRLEALHLA